MINIAVIIVTWNSSELIESVLDALKHQSMKPKRLLIIDNGSDDAEITAKLVAGYLEAEILLLPQNLGFAAANNIGIQCCSDMEFVALLNPDAFPQPEWLEKLVLAAKIHPDVTGFASRLLNFADHELLDGAGDCLSILGRPKRRGHGALARGLFNSIDSVFCPSAAAALYRQNALVQIGGFDDDYFCYIEDIDLGFRLRLAGLSSIYVPDAVVYHIGSATTGGQHSYFSVYHGHRNLVWTFVKNMPGILFWALLPMHLMLNIVTVIYFMLHGQGRVILLSKWDAIKGIPRMWRKRQMIQNNRVASIADIWRVLDKRLLISKMKK